MTGSSGGLLRAVTVIAVAAGMTSAVVALPQVLPEVQRTAAPVRERLPLSLSTQPLVCPGPETLLVPEGGTAVDPGAAVLVTALVEAESESAGARLTLSGDDSDRAEEAARTLPSGLGAASAPVTRGNDLDLAAGSAGPTVGSLAVTSLGPALLRPTTSDGPPPSLAAVQSTLARSGPMRALTATSCAAPAAQSWLVGGSTVDGARLRLLLANPAATAAVVDVDVRGPEGRVRTPSGEGVVVPAGAAVPMFVDALAPGLEQVVVHVTARSGRVRATLHESRSVGVDPGGADDVAAGAEPARQQVIPGISLVNGYGKTADDPAAAGSTAVRVAVPGTEEAVVRVRLLDSTGAVELPQAAVVSVPAGGVVDVPVSGIPSGTYAAVIDADVPVVAGALVGRGPTAGQVPASEFAWAGAARPLAGSGYLVLPPASRSTLSLVAPKGAGEVVVREVRADGTLGKPVDVQVPGNTSATVQFGPEAVAVRIDEVSGAGVGAGLVSWVTDPRGSLISVLSVDLAVTSDPPTSAIADRVLGLR